MEKPSGVVPSGSSAVTTVWRAVTLLTEIGNFQRPVAPEHRVVGPCAASLRVEIEVQVTWSASTIGAAGPLAAKVTRSWIGEVVGGIAPSEAMRV